MLKTRLQNPPGRCQSLHSEGRTDRHMTKLTVAFRNFAKAPKNTWQCIYFTKKHENGLKCAHYWEANKDYNLYLKQSMECLLNK